MAASKTEKKLNTYATLRGLLVAKSKGLAPRGIKVDHSKEYVDFMVGDVIVLSVNHHDFVADAIKRLGFVERKI